MISRKFAYADNLALLHSSAGLDFKPRHDYTFNVSPDLGGSSVTPRR